MSNSQSIPKVWHFLTPENVRVQVELIRPVLAVFWECRRVIDRTTVVIFWNRLKPGP